MALSKRCLLLLLLLLRASVSACWRASNSSWSSRSRAFRDSTNLAICGSIRQVSQPAKGSRVTSRRCKTAAVCVGGWLVVHLTKPFPLFLEFSPLHIQCLPPHAVTASPRTRSPLPPPAVTARGYRAAAPLRHIIGKRSHLPPFQYFCTCFAALKTKAADHTDSYASTAAGRQKRRQTTAPEKSHRFRADASAVSAVTVKVGL